jgi:putative ABC transport system permease protein
MNNALVAIPLVNLAFAFIPVALVVVLLFRWSLDGKTAVYAVMRMLLQLLLIGYALNWIFAGDSAIVVSLLLAFMLCVASWIAMRPLDRNEPSVYAWILLSIALGGGGTLALIAASVLEVKPWYSPRQVIPLAGMIFANSMNAVSLAAERFAAELRQGNTPLKSRNAAFQAALIPLINSLFAVGLVSLPGMMTGQILSGVEPLIAARYQIMVMCMLFGAAGLSAAIYLSLVMRNYATPSAKSGTD